MSTAKTSWRVHFTDSDLATLLDLTQRQKEHADAKVNRLTDPREKSFYSSVSERLAAFREKLSTMEPGDTALSDLDLKWLSSLVTREQRHTQERFDAARQRVCKEAITLGGQLERLYSLSYQLSKPLSRKASGVARRLKAEEAAAEQLRQEEIALDILPALSLTAARSRGKGRGFPLQDGHARPQPLSQPYSQQA